MFKLWLGIVQQQILQAVLYSAAPQIYTGAEGAWGKGGWGGPTSLPDICLRQILSQRLLFS